MKHLFPKIAPKKRLFASSFAEEITPLSSDTRFTLSPSNGPAMTRIGPANTGISGAHTLKVSGKIEDGGCYSAVLFDGLSIPVSADTKLRYHLFPAMHTAHYDHSYTVYTRPCHYINPLRGTNDSPAFSRGLTTPAILTPQGFNMYAPCTNAHVR